MIRYVAVALTTGMPRTFARFVDCFCSFRPTVTIMNDSLGFCIISIVRRCANAASYTKTVIQFLSSDAKQIFEKSLVNLDIKFNG